ncbi:MAG: hypothetical protein WC055_02295 [Melioribacteraceae bacterium]
MDKIKGFSQKETDNLIASSDKYKKEGMSDVDADTKAVMDLYASLQEEINKLKTKSDKQESVKKTVSVKPELVKEAPKTTSVESKSREVKDVEINQVEKNALISEGYDNSTINKAVKEANELRRLPAKELFKVLNEKGVFNLGKGDTNVERPDIGLASSEYNNTLSQLEKSKDTKTIEKLMNFIEDIKETGVIKTIRGTGGKTERFSAPLHRSLLEKSNPDRGLTEIEEKEKLAEEETRLAYESQLEDAAQYQKVSDKAGNISKAVDRIKKVMPKVNVVMDNTIKGAGQVKGNTLSINPDYAGFDTPIHEAGHILIDSIGYSNKVIQAAIAQLKTTPLWEETKKLYSDLNEEMLGKEVLAEAIGREGAGIFDKEVDKTRFKALLDYIFNKLKQLFGVDKNIAKSLAKQIIGGIKTKELVGKNETVQEARKREISEDEAALNELYEVFKNTPDLSKFKYEDLLDAYNIIITSTDIPQGKENKIKNEILKRIGMNFFQRSMDKARNDPKFSEEKAIKKDIGWFDKQFKVLSHFSNAFPEMKGLSDLWQTAYFDKIKASREKKNLNEKLAVEVIKDRNDRLGIVQRGKEFIQQLLGNQNYKYFDYLDNGKGGLITVSEANQKGYTKAQIDYLKFVREEIGERKNLIASESYDVAMDVLRTDKRFYENFQTENSVAAVSSLLGNTHNINKVRIKFTNPLTGKEEISEYENIEKILTKYGEKGVKEKFKALLAIGKYNYRARKQLKESVSVDEKGESNVLNVIRKGEYSLDENGQLKSKFDRPREETRAYSKDFYTAMQEFIDDTQHIKHISPLIPIINAIDYINKNGAYEFDEDGNRVIKHGKKDNVSEWLKEWTNLHVIKRPNETDPALDLGLRFLRNWASLSTMMFNTPAQFMNMAIGNYNNWRKDNSKTWAKGQARLFGGGKRKVTKDYAYGLVNPYAIDIARKYGAVSTDVDSNPISTAGGIMAKLGFLGTKWGEFQIQASGMLGKLSDEDYNSFEYKKNKFGVDELVVKDEIQGEKRKALEKRILDAIDEVSDVQGKYSDKDKMNIMNNELGKSIMQYKVWMPAWYRTRFGEEGSFTTMVNGGIKEIRDQIKDEGFMKTLASGNDTKAVKDFKSNIKGLMVTALLMSFVYSDDEDKKKSLAAKTAQKALSDVLFIFDPNNLKFTISRPIASVSKINDLLDAVTKLNEIDSKDVVKLLPGKKVADAVEYLTEED